jgi:acyl carrier protein phosphodiesterase
MADFVKGKDYQKYPAAIQKGILLHREIDHYTDQHRYVLTSKRRLQPRYRHYAGVIVDMYYDHFLANNFQQYHKEQLPNFCDFVYRTVYDHHHLLPAKVKHLIEHMSAGNWLLSYAQLSGIEQALGGISRRTKFDSGMEYAGFELRNHYQDFLREFMAFFPEVIRFAKDKAATL